MRSDEVSHAAEVQSPAKGVYQNSRSGRNRYKDIHLTEGGLKTVKGFEKSAEVIVPKETSRA